MGKRQNHAFLRKDAALPQLKTSHRHCLQVHLLQDLHSLPEFLDFNEDRRPDPVQDDEPLLCPDTLDVMFLRQTYDKGHILGDNQIAAARTYPAAEDEGGEKDEYLTESEGSQYHLCLRNSWS
jgi:hypothetical protein